ncbi:MAG: hypothetical protein J5I93_25365 [Pirellulaceae bacterium]|nr:hypothetical protein [Pirellulaceae bacterium]
MPIVLPGTCRALALLAAGPVVWWLTCGQNMLPAQPANRQATAAANSPVGPVPVEETACVKRALEFLSREVARWPADNKCFSCHNNGDAARALYHAQRLGFPVPAAALDDTNLWLLRPAEWEHNGGEGEFSDKQLADLQFGASLLAAIDSSAVRGDEALGQVAARIADAQTPTGCWKADAAGSLGSPVTYGPFLSTALASQLLRTADARRFQPQLDLAQRWLRSQRPENMLNASGALLALDDGQDHQAQALRQHCLALLRDSQHRGGGWGPYRNQAPEPFDTAVVLLALRRAGDPGLDGERMARGRAYLVASQLDDGSWPETTRPPLAESYAQRLSTSGWATLALLRQQPNR